MDGFPTCDAQAISKGYCSKHKFSDTVTHNANNAGHKTENVRHARRRRCRTKRRRTSRITPSRHLSDWLSQQKDSYDAKDYSGYDSWDDLVDGMFANVAVETNTTGKLNLL